MKKTALIILYAFTAGICITGSNIHAEPVDGVAPDTTAKSATKSVTVDVTRTDEGVVVVTPEGRRVLDLPARVRGRGRA